MKLNDILIEQDSLDQYKDNISVALNSDVILYRSSKKLPSKKVRVIDPRTTQPRRSSTGYNILLEWTSNDSSWNMFPKRNRSIVMSTNAEATKNFGDILFRVYPFYDANLGVGSGADFNYAEAWPYIEQKNIINMMVGSELTKAVFILSRLLLAYQVHPKQYSADSYSDIVEILHEFNDFKKRDLKQFKNMVSTAAFNESHILNYLAKQGENAIDVFRDLLSPIKNKFNVMSINNINTLSDNVEVWTDSPCVLERI